MQEVDFIIDELEALASAQHRHKMTSFGIDNDRAFGVSVPKIRALAKQIGINQQLSLALWQTGVHEARILAAFIGDYKLVNEEQINIWTHDFNSWDICDQVCSNLFIKTQFLVLKVNEYTQQEGEFVKRCGFVLMAEAAVHLKKEPDATFIDFFPIIEREAYDERNFVRKAVNWALRQIGKRNAFLHALALESANRILAQQHKKANWVALNARRELQSDKVLSRIVMKSSRFPYPR